MFHDAALTSANEVIGGAAANSPGVSLLGTSRAAVCRCGGHGNVPLRLRAIPLLSGWPVSFGRPPSSFQAGGSAPVHGADQNEPVSRNFFGLPRILRWQ